MSDHDTTNIEDDFTLISGYIRNISGIFLKRADAYLLESKLNPLLLSSGCTNYTSLCLLAKNDKSHTINRQLIDAITTRETYFFRDKGTFQLLQNRIFPDHFKGVRQGGQEQNSIDIWCAACSTGQEVYSVAILLKEYLQENFSTDSARIVGTDISSAAVAASQSATYSAIEMSRGLSEQQKSKYFNKKRGIWKVSKDITESTRFVKSNLQDSHDELGLFDIIICKNVTIYFSEEGKKRLFNRLADQLLHKGILILSSMESFPDLSERFTSIACKEGTYYEKIA